jgi:hypothetical protein
MKSFNEGVENTEYRIRDLYASALFLKEVFGTSWGNIILSRKQNTLTAKMKKLLFSLLKTLLKKDMTRLWELEQQQ